MTLPEPVLNLGAIYVTWWPARITRPLDYPTPGESHWLPEGTEGWAFQSGRGWTFTASDLTGFWETTNRFSVPKDAIEKTGEFMQQPYYLPDSAYDTDPPYEVDNPKLDSYVEDLEERTEMGL